MRWGVVVPVKALALAKTRLHPYGDEVRRALALAMAADVVAAGAACPGVERVLVVTDDAEVSATVAALGGSVCPDPGGGLNPALEHGAARLRSADPALAVAALAADLPALRPATLAAALARLPPLGRGLVVDAPGTGTTLLAAAAGVPLAAAFGPGSRRRHRDSGAVELLAGPGLRLDVDTPADLARALDLGVGPRTAAVVAALTAAAQ